MAVLDIFFLVAASLSMLLLAAVLLTLDFQGAVNRALALVLVLRGGLVVAGQVLTAIDGTRGWGIALNDVGYITTAFASLAFLVLYRERYGGAMRRPWLAPLLLCAGLFLELVYFAGRDLFVFNGRLGPLSPLLSILMPSYALVGAVLARDWQRAKKGPFRSALLLVSAGFALDPLYLSGRRPFMDSLGVGSYVLPAETQPGGLVFVIRVLEFLPLLIVLVGALFVFRGVLRAEHRSTKRAGLTYLLALLAVLATIALFAATGATAAGISGEGNATVDFVADGIWTLAFPALVGYTLLRHQLFDIDLRLKWTIRRSALAGMFVATFFVVAQTAQNFFTESFGWVLGGVSAGLLLFAINPLQRMAEKVADVAMPGVADPRAQRSEAGREDIFQAAVEMALSDKVVTRAEERSLAKLAGMLNISAPRALDLREAVESRLGIVP